ncbi:hypothetical protein SAY86_023971 [Trapa natans]|uniref:Uncharacterized protein n=1 Tax=Trapa natans TaxID=22666 RepID=A0AAN7MBB8_TRANT|nr:hypothetical protein SAY86_023971 [Trapa natans]
MIIQVERAFREGTARQNAHSIFVCLALKLLEERLGLACKDIITFKKQMKLLEEEEKERREEEEQKERKKMKEREKKLRRKERLKGKYKDTEEKTSNLEETPSSNISKEELLLNADEVVNEAVGSKDAVSTNGETVCDRQVCSNIEVEGPFLEVEDQYVNHGTSPEQIKASHGKLQPRKPVDQSLKWYDRHQFSFVAEDGPKVGRSIPRYHSDNSQNNSRVIYVANRQLNVNHQKTNLWSSASRNSEKFHCGNGRMNERLEGHSCGCNHVCDYQTNNDLPVSAIRTSRGSKYMVKSESVLDVPKHLHGGSKYCQAGRSKSKVIIGSNYPGKKDSIQFRKVWEPLESQKRCPRSNSASDIPSINSGFKIEQASSDSTKSSSELCSSSEDIGDSTEINHQSTKMRKHIKEKGEVSRSEAEDGTAEPTQAARAMKSSCSNSDNCSSCPSEGDSNTPSPNDENPGSSSTSDSECVSQQTELRVDLGHNGVSDSHNVSTKAPEVKNRVQTSVIDQPSLGFLAGGSGNSHYAYPSIEPPSHPSSDQNSTPSSMGYKSHAMFPDRRYHQNLCLQMFQTPSNVGYYAHQNLISWAPFPASGLYPHANSYLYPGFLGYGLDANQGLCMPYEAMHHFTTRMISGGPTIPFSNPAQGPAPPTNGIYVEKKPQLSKQSTGGKLADSAIYRERPSEASRPGGRRDLLAEACQENSGFSLFQFGVPFGVPFGMPVDASNTKLPEDASSMVPTDAVKDSFPDCCQKEDTAIEQYNLFAANCGTMFSFP